MTSTTQHSLKLLEQQSQKEKDSATDCGLQNQELHSLLLTSSENISACLQERYCNGDIDAPLHTLTVTTPPSLKSSAWIDTSKIIQNMDIDSQSETKKNTQDLLSERYCNGIMGVPVTFLDKMSPNQFKIIGRADGNIKYDTPECYIRGFNDKGGVHLIGERFTYGRILILRKI